MIFGHWQQGNDFARCVVVVSKPTSGFNSRPIVIYNDYYECIMTLVIDLVFKFSFAQVVVKTPSNPQNH